MFCAPRAGDTFPDEGKGIRKARPSGREDPPQGNAPPLRPCFLRQGRGTALLSPDADGCKNADKSGSGEVETGRLCSERRLFFISSTARGLSRGKRSGSARAGREREFHGGSACEVSRKFIASSLAGAYAGKCRPDWVGRSGRGTALLSPDADGCKNADKSRSGDVETGCLCSGRRLFFISSTARGSPRGNRFGSTRAGREREFHGGSACEVSRKFIASSLAGGGRTGFSRYAGKCRPDWVGRSGRGTALLSRNSEVLRKRHCKRKRGS